MYRTRSMILLACLLLSALYPRCCRSQGVHPSDPNDSTSIVIISRHHKDGGWQALHKDRLGVFQGGTSRAGQEVLLHAWVRPSLAAGSTVRWAVGESADDAVAGFSYSEEGSDKVPAGENLFISPRAGGPVPLSKTEATQTIRFFWVDGSPNGLPKPVDCVIFGGNGKLAGPWKPATAKRSANGPRPRSPACGSSRMPKGA